MGSSVIVWDLETVPDLAGFAAANDLVGKSEVEVREAIGDKFPKHIYHSIVCIGALIAHREPGHWAVDAVGAPHVGERSEKQLIAAFCDKIAELSPQLVTFNGNSFDLPVLRYRAMIHGVSAPGLSVRPYFNRYTEDAIDLCDALSSFNSQGKATLHEISRIMGLLGKPDGFDGAEVERYFQGGKIKDIADYCESDLANTYGVWLRYELFRGRLTEHEFEESQQNLTDFMNGRAVQINNVQGTDGSPKSTDAKQLAGEMERALASGQRNILSPDALQTLMAAVCKVYAAQVESGEPPLLPLSDRGATTTDVMVTASGLLKAANLAVFELGMWQSWTGR